MRVANKDLEKTILFLQELLQEQDDPSMRHRIELNIGMLEGRLKAYQHRLMQLDEEANDVVVAYLNKNHLKNSSPKELLEHFIF